MFCWKNFQQIIDQCIAHKPIPFTFGQCVSGPGIVKTTSESNKYNTQCDELLHGAITLPGQPSNNRQHQNHFNKEKKKMNKKKNNNYKPQSKLTIKF
jgi:hypothetical protein